MPSFSTHRFQLALACLALAALLLPASALAEEPSKARKFGRGLAAITTAFLEVPGNMMQEGRTNGAVSGFTLGFAIGVGKIIPRVLTGLYDTLTAPSPTPWSRKPLIQPEFPWSYFESAPGRAYGFSDSYLEEERRKLSQIEGAQVTRRQGAVIVRFQNELLFDSSETDVSRKSKKRIEEVAVVLKRLPDAQFAVLGFTDSTGPEDYNEWLSRSRARAVRTLLVEEGIPSRRVVAEGYGEVGPVASNRTAEGRQANRRVEIQVRASGVGAYR